MAAGGGSSSRLLLLLVTAHATLAQQPLQLYQQCGGNSQCEQHICDDVTWPNTGCADGLVCQRQSEWFWQCMEGQQGSKKSGASSGSPSPTPSLAPSPASTTAGAAKAASKPQATPSPPAAAASKSSPAPAPLKASPSPPAPLAKGAVDAPGCPPYLPTARNRRGNYTDWINTTRTISPKRPSANVELGKWIPGRATFYGTDKRIEAARVACGEPPGQYGVIEHGSCGFTDADGSLPYPVDGYAAAADTNEDYPGSCGRCYQIRCRSGIPQNNGRDIHISDLPYGRAYNMTDDQGRYWPGNRLEKQDRFHTQCWDEDATITVRIGDSCPCFYNIQVPKPELRLQPWCCGGQNHFDLSVWAFQKLLHPTYGVMKMEYRPVDCATNQPIKAVPGFISRTIYRNGPQPGWGWRPYFSKGHVLRKEGAGVKGGTAACATLSKSGAMAFFCRNCTQEGYQPFATAKALEFWIRSNTPEGADKYASSTPRGIVPALKVFLMHDEANKYCFREVILGPKQVVAHAGADWFKMSLPLAMWACDKGSAGSLANINRVDFQNTLLRDADVCIDAIVLTT